MGFDHNPYRHLEIIAAPEIETPEERLARAMLGLNSDSPDVIPVSVMDEARRALSAGYTPPERVLPVPDAWVWYCHNCGGRGRDPHIDLAKLVADWVGHLIASHDACLSDFKGWTEV